MRQITKVLGVLLVALLWTSAGYAQTRGDVDRRIDDLLARMTMEEKVGQMTQIELGVVSEGEGGRAEPHRLDAVKLRDAIVDHHVGSIINVINHAYSLDHWSEVITQIEDVATKETQLGIPVIYGIDAVHGVNYTEGATLFPQNVGMAATFDPVLMRTAAAITAREARASGIPWNFSPVLGMGRQPLWARFYETFGEDVYLARRMARAVVEGYQGDDVGAPDKVAASLKHYVGYSAPTSGKDRTTASLPDRVLREVFLPPFREAIEAGAKSVMVNSGDVNGVPVHASHYLLTDVLRGEMGFDGVIVSDWEDIAKLHTIHHVAATRKEATRMAVAAGIDMSMVPYDFSFYDDLLALVHEGSVPEARIDASVRRILRMKMELGLFDDPYPDPAMRTSFATREAKDTALRAARESITLLKNDGDVLPLDASARVLVTGPTARSITALGGGWTYTWQGMDSTYATFYPDAPSILGALTSKAAQVTYVPGTTVEEEIDVAAAASAARQADVAVVCLGEEAYAEKPGDINDMTLPEAQLHLVQAVAATGTPVVLVLVEGRPRVFTRVADDADAIVLAYQPGIEGGRALGDVLFGDYNPSGRLPFSYPRYPNDLVTYDHAWSAATGVQYGGIGVVTGYDPLYPFGYGLSYTTFAYSDLDVSTTTPGLDESLDVSVTVTNAGERAGTDVVQLYLSDAYASVAPAVKRLKRFARVSLDPGASQTLTFTLGKDDYSFVGMDGRPVVEPGSFEVQVGDLKASFELRDVGTQ